MKTFKLIAFLLTEYLQQSEGAGAIHNIIKIEKLKILMLNVVDIMKGAANTLHIVTIVVPAPTFKTHS